MKNTFFFILGATFFVLLGFSTPPHEGDKFDQIIVNPNEIDYITKEDIITDFDSQEVMINHDVIDLKQQIHVEPEGRWVMAKVTAYCPCAICCGKSKSHSLYGITSIGVNVLSNNPNDAYGIAADPRVLPYNTKIYVPGYWESLQNNKSFVPNEMIRVDDTGGAMRQSWKNERVIHLDVRYRTHKAAKSWGVKYMKVFVYQ